MSPLITPPLQLPWASPKVPSKCSPVTLQALLSQPAVLLSSRPRGFPPPELSSRSQAQGM